jgi:hypothetical protein
MLRPTLGKTTPARGGRFRGFQLMSVGATQYNVRQG